jgi:hypothetical protein
MRRLTSRVFTVLATLLLCAGCASRNVTSYYHETEARLATSDDQIYPTGLFHDALYNPEAINLNFDGLIIGLDKSPRASVGAVVGGQDFRAQTQTGMGRVVRQLQQHPKALYISHILLDRGLPFADGNCALYSVYPPQAGGSDASQDAGALVPACPEYPLRAVKAGAEYAQSFDALDDLAALVGQRAASGRYTHLLIVVMGWNTGQIEALRNFNSLVSHIHRAAVADGKPFRPLFVGVTWPSLWSSAWIEPALVLGSYKNKADDADKLGAGWLGAIVGQLSHAAAPLPAIVIGHSFGARASSMATCAGAQFARAVPAPAVDLLIGLEPAVSIHRFLPGGGDEGIEYPHECANAKKIALTFSSQDAAVGRAGWVDFAGAAGGYRAVCAGHSPLRRRQAGCLRVNGDGRVAPGLDGSHADFVYFDASRLIRFNQPNTGGGAHSDIYRAETGRLLWDLIEWAAPDGRKQ